MVSVRSAHLLLLAAALCLSAVSGFGFGVPSSSLASARHSTTHTTRPTTKRTTTTTLFGIRCEDKTYQLEEMEDKDTCTTEVYLQADRSIYFGDTDGPLPDDVLGRWDVEPDTDNFKMAIRRTFGTGSDSRDMGEFSFEVEKLYVGEMTKVGDSVAINGVMKMKDPMNPEVEIDCGFFNMIDGTDERTSYVEKAGGRLTS